MAAAGLWTTASDLARFAIEMGLSRQGRANHILRQSTVEQMMTVQKGDFGLGFALSEQNGVKRFGHNGADEGFQALLTCSYEGEGVAVMVSSDNGIRLANELARAVSAAYGWKDMKPLEKTVMPISAAQLAEYAGDYQVETRVWEFRVAGDHLMFGRKGGPSTTPMYPETTGQFFLADDDATKFTFQRTDGAVTSVKVGRREAKKISKKD